MLQTKPSPSHLSALFIMIMSVLLLANRPVQSQELAELWEDDAVPISLAAGYGVGGDVSSGALALGFGTSKSSEFGFSIGKHNSRIRRNTTSANSIAVSYTAIGPGKNERVRGAYTVTASRIFGAKVQNTLYFGGRITGFVSHKLSPVTTIYPSISAGVMAPVIRQRSGATPRPIYSISSSISMITGKRGARFALQAGITRDMTDKQFLVSIGIGIVFLAPKDERTRR